MEKRLEITPKQSYVNRITTMLNSGMIPTGNSDTLYRFLLGKTRPGKIKAGIVTTSSAAK